MTLWSVIAVAIGGALGTLGRLSAELAMDGLVWGQEGAILGVNLLGAAALGAITGHGLPRWSPAMRDGLSVGVVGSYTTLSAVALIVTASGWTGGLGYAALTLFLGLALAWAGYRAARAWRSHHDPEVVA